MKPYILCFGLPGSGKSTSTRKLYTHFADKKYIMHNNRDLRASMGMHPFDFSHDRPEQREKLDEVYASIDTKLKWDWNLIIDKAGTQERVRGWAYDLASYHGKDLLAIWHDIPDEIAYDRIRQRPDEHMEWDRAIKHNDIGLRKKFEPMWRDPTTELDQAKYSHVSMIKYHTDSGTFSSVKINPELNDFIVLVTNILSEE